MRLGGWITIVAFAALLCMTTSCATPSRAVAIEHIESLERKGWSGVEVGMVVRNSSRSDITIDSCNIHILSNNLPLGTLSLRGGVQIPKRSNGELSARFKLLFPSIATTQSLWRQWSEGQTRHIGIRVEGRMKSGAISRTFSTETTSLSEILNIFGITNSEFSLYFKE